MPESWWAVILLGVMSVGVLVMTATVFMAARDLRRTVRQVSRMLPDCDRAVHEARRTLASIRQLLARTDHTTRQLEGVIHKACDTASGVIGRVVFLKDKAEDFLAGRFGNGARSGPRQRAGVRRLGQTTKLLANKVGQAREAASGWIAEHVTNSKHLVRHRA